MLSLILANLNLAPDPLRCGLACLFRAQWPLIVGHEHRFILRYRHYDPRSALLVCVSHGSFKLDACI